MPWSQYLGTEPAQPDLLIGYYWPIRKRTSQARRYFSTTQGTGVLPIDFETSSLAMALFQPARLRFEEEVKSIEAIKFEVMKEILSVEEALTMAQVIRQKIKSNIREKTRAEALYWQPLYDENEEE